MILETLHHLSLFMCIFWGTVFYCDVKDNRVQDGAENIRMVKRVLLNQVLVAAPITLALDWASSDVAGSFLPLRIVTGILLGEFAVYFAHREMHRNQLLRLVHASHHLPIKSSAQAMDANMIEIAVLNVIAPLLPLVLCGVGSSVLRAASLIGTLVAVLTHSKWFGKRVFSHGHDNHHLSPTTNFSTFLVADRFMGTLFSKGRSPLPKTGLELLAELRSRKKQSSN